jgi:hypothetical protein
MLQNFLKNPFLAKSSDANFGKLVSIHLESLKAANTDNRHSSLITTTEPLYLEFASTLSTKSGNNSAKGGKTVRTHEAFTSIKAYISRKEGVIADKFPRQSATYREFFPIGLSEYHKASKANIQLLAERFIRTAQANANVLGSEMASEAKDLVDTYLATRNAQLQAMGSVKGLSSESKAKRKALAIQLYRNLLHLLASHVEDTGQVKNYFDTAIRQKPKKEVKALEE